MKEADDASAGNYIPVVIHIFDDTFLYYAEFTVINSLLFFYDFVFYDDRIVFI